MLVELGKQLKASCLMFLWLSLITGVAYPVVVTALGGALFPHQAAGSLVSRDGVVTGSALIGQPFAPGRYFAGRPSATSPFPCNAAASGGSNLGPTSKALADRLAADVAAAKQDNPSAPVPVDLVTTSGSGLDPEISPEAALFQVPRIAKVRNLPEAELRALVDSRIEGRDLGLFGEPRVNVLKLNLALDRLGQNRPRT